jgi:hypothetical protein
MRKKSSLFVLLAVLSMGMAFFATNARADLIGFDLATPNTALSNFQGPYANVQINMAGLNQKSVTITVSTYSGYSLGDGSSIALKTNGTATVSNITGMSNPQWSNTTGQTLDGFGTFDLTITN